MPAELAVWLYGGVVATIEELRGRRLRLTHTPEAVDRYGLGVPLLSVALPLRPEPYTHGPARAFLEGLLPEGEPRTVIARDLRLSTDDVFGFLEALGRDCAGALVIQPFGEDAPARATTRTAAPLEEGQLEQLVRDLRSAPLGIGGPVRLSLAGVQEKLLLTRMPDGRWGRPVHGTPSSHILKPEIDRFPKTVENEFFCMRVARELGLEAPDVSMATIGKRRVLFVERYDRRIDADGAVERIHQEDLCQATGIAPERKYEDDGGPSLRRMAEIVQTAATAEALEAFLRAVTLNTLVANGDAHSKNYSLLHERAGILRLAPVYDMLSTAIYGDTRLGARIDGVQRMDRVTGERLLNEAGSWGMSRRRARDIVGELIERAPLATQRAREETPGLPTELVPTLDAQLARLQTGIAVPS